MIEIQTYKQNESTQYLSILDSVNNDNPGGQQFNFIGDGVHIVGYTGVYGPSQIPSTKEWYFIPTGVFSAYRDENRVKNVSIDFLNEDMKTYYFIDNPTQDQKDNSLSTEDLDGTTWLLGVASDDISEFNGLTTRTVYQANRIKESNINWTDQATNFARIKQNIKDDVLFLENFVEDFAAFLALTANTNATQDLAIRSLFEEFFNLVQIKAPGSAMEKLVEILSNESLNGTFTEDIKSAKIEEVNAYRNQFILDVNDHYTTNPYT